MKRRRVTDDVLGEINRLDLQGYTQQEISDETGVPRPTVQRHLVKLRVERRAARNITVGYFIDQLNQLKREAGRAWREERDDDRHRKPSHCANVLKILHEQARILGFGSKVDLMMSAQAPPPQRLISLVVKNRDQLKDIMQIDEFRALMDPGQDG